MLTETLGIELKHTPSDSAFRYFFYRSSPPSLPQFVSVQSLRFQVASLISISLHGVIYAGGWVFLIAAMLSTGEEARHFVAPSSESWVGGLLHSSLTQVTLLSEALDVASAQACYAISENHEQTLRWQSSSAKQ